MTPLEDKIAGFADEQKHVLAAYLFGSEATGQARSGSDVDVGFLYSRGHEPKMDEFLKTQDQLISVLGRETDIVILNNASPVIRMQVLKKGKKVYERDRAAAIDFFVRTVNDYDDLKKVRSVIEKNIERGRIYG